MDVSEVASLDYETGSAIDLRKVGAAKYSEHPSTRIICASYQLPGAPVKNWRYRDPIPHDLLDWVAQGGLLSGWNITFEYWIWTNVMRRQWTNVFIPELKPEQLIDTMAVAATNGLPLGLDDAAKAMPHLGVTKDKDGHALMMRMNKPRKIHGDGTMEWWHEQDPARLKRLMAYCDRDVRTERTILKDLVPMSRNERDVWEMDFDIMRRGMKFDDVLAEKMELIAEREKVRLDGLMSVMTVGQVKTTRAAGQLLKYVQVDDPQIKSLAKDQLAKWIADPSISPRTRAILEIRREAAKSSVAKLTAMRNWACADGRMRGLTQYYAAFRTGRWGGRGPQLQNYPRSEVKDQEGLVDYILGDGDEDGFEIFFGVTPLSGLSSALRGCVTVDGHKLFGALDFSQIEARVLPWLAGDEKLLDVFRTGKDIYVVAASGIYKLPEDQINGDQRQVGKVSVLALGYAGGVGAFQTMAKVYGVEVPNAEADQIKSDWRAANPKIVNLWYDLERAAIKAVRNPGVTFHAGHNDRLELSMRGPHLTIRLPSGRLLWYRDAQIGVGNFGNDCVTYMGKDQYTNQWGRIDTYGGKLVENVTQAVARDVMASAMLRCHHRGFLVIGSVHDEALFEFYRENRFESAKALFEQVPQWARGLPIEADGYLGKRFKKG